MVTVPEGANAWVQQCKEERVDFAHLATHTMLARVPLLLANALNISSSSKSFDICPTLKALKLIKSDRYILAISSSPDKSSKIFRVMISPTAESWSLPDPLLTIRTYRASNERYDHLIAALTSGDNKTFEVLTQPSLRLVNGLIGGVTFFIAGDSENKFTSPQRRFQNDNTTSLPGAVIAEYVGRPADTMIANIRGIEYTPENRTSDIAWQVFDNIAVVPRIREIGFQTTPEGLRKIEGKVDRDGLVGDAAVLRAVGQIPLFEGLETDLQDLLDIR